MKVKDLIKKLEQFDEEMEVKIKEEIYGYGGQYLADIEYYEISEVFTDGEYDDKEKIVVITN